MTIPGLSETLIQQHTTSQSFDRGLQYYDYGAVVSVVQRGAHIQAEVEGSQYEPYQVTIVWDAVSGEAALHLEGRRSTEAYKYYYPGRGPAWVQSVDWSPDGKRLATGGGDFVVRIFDAASGAELRMIEGPETIVLAVAWAPDSQQLALTGIEGRTNIALWNAIGDEPLYGLVDHPETVHSLDWAHEGNRLASVGNDGVIRIWEIPE